MKGTPGLIAAAVLGILGVGLNWFYLERKSSQFDNVQYIGIAANTEIHPGDRFERSHFAPVEVPRNASARLEGLAVKWEDVDTVVGMNAVKEYRGDELLWRKDLETPPPELELAENERALWIPVDQKTFVPSLVMPGDEVDFLVPRVRYTPVPQTGDGSPQPTPAGQQLGQTDIVGPFKILSIGNRLGKSNVLNAARVPQLQENIVTVRVKMNGAMLDQDAQRLLDGLHATNYRELGILLRPRRKAGG